MTIDVPEFLWEASLLERLSPLVLDLEPDCPVSALPISAYHLSTQNEKRESIVFLFPDATGLEYKDGHQDERVTLLVQIRLKDRTRRDFQVKSAVAVAVTLIQRWLLGYRLPKPAITDLQFNRRNLYQVDKGLWEAEIEFSFNSRIYPVDPTPEQIPEILRITHVDEQGILTEVKA